jgi:hypothetical protein
MRAGNGVTREPLSGKAADASSEESEIPLAARATLGSPVRHRNERSE